MSWITDVRDIQKKLSKLYDPKNLANLTGKKEAALLKQVRTLTNDMMVLVQNGLGNSLKIKDYLNEYEKTMNILKKQGFKGALHPKDTKGIEAVKDSLMSTFSTDTSNVTRVAEYYAQNGIETTRQSIKTIDQVLKEDQRIERDKKLTNEEKIDLKKRNSSSIREIFTPRYTILKLPDESPTAQKRFGNQFKGKITTAHDEVMKQMDIGYKKGETRNQIQKRVQKIVDKRFPQGKVTTTNYRNGKAVVWSQDTVNYAAGWVRNGSTRFASEATVDAMTSVGADIVKYVLGAVEDHTDICKQLAGGSPYSLSGQSTKYPKLPQAPPASPPVHPCKSRLSPAPSSEQEIHRFPDERKKDIFAYEN